MVGEHKAYSLTGRGCFPWREEDTEGAMEAVSTYVKNSLVVS